MTNERLERCLICGQPGIETSKPAETFWRCQACRQAVVRRGGRLQPWLDINTAGTRIGKRKAFKPKSLKGKLR